MPSTRCPANLLALPWSSWLQAWEISVAAPQVVAHRMTRMMLGGWPPSVADQREYRRMIGEKGQVYLEAMIAGMLAWQRGAGAVLAASQGPVHRTVTANRRRLAKTRR